MRKGAKQNALGPSPLRCAVVCLSHLEDPFKGRLDGEGDAEHSARDGPHSRLKRNGWNLVRCPLNLIQDKTEVTGTDM